MILKSSEKTDVNMTELVATVDAETFEKAIEAVYQRQKKNISLPGFRKGKVPRRLCERTYGEGVFFEEAFNIIYPDAMEMPGVIAEAALNLVDAPKVEVTSVSKEDGATVKIICVTKPEIHIADYKGMTAPKEDKEITDEDVAKQAENVCKRNAKMVSVDDRAAEMGDEVTLDFEGFFGDTPFEGGKGEDFQLKLGSGQFIPGFEEQVAGHKIDEDFDVTVTFPEDYQMTDYAGKEAVFKCKIHSISKEEIPELTDDFVKEISDFDTVDEWKADAKKKLEENAEQTAKVGFENALVAKLIDKVQDPIPHCMFEQRADGMMDAFANQLKGQNVDLDLYLQYTGMTKDQLKETYLERAENEVKLRLALEKIAELEGLKALVVDDEIVALKALTRRIQWEKYGVDQVFTARSMQQAQQVLKNEEIDFMLCDIEMPNGTGLDLAEWMRQHYPEIECVFITGHEDFDYARRALRLGSVDYVLKPVNYEEMDTILMKLVKSLSRKAVVESVSESIVHDLEERDSENASVIPKVKQYIIEHLSENIYIEDLAKEVHLNPQYLMRIFKKEENISILEFMMKKRIEVAEKLLLHTDYHVNKIADMVGYGNYSYFSKIFKRETGKTPAQFRKEN